MFFILKLFFVSMFLFLLVFKGVFQMLLAFRLTVCHKVFGTFQEVIEHEVNKNKTRLLNGLLHYKPAR